MVAEPAVLAEAEFGAQRTAEADSGLRFVGQASPQKESVVQVGEHVEHDLGIRCSRCPEFLDLGVDEPGDEVDDVRSVWGGGLAWPQDRAVDDQRRAVRLAGGMP
ncbi:hypothetical protein [Streptomyces sp. ST2-7A]|uniref:hypothetical protein n=1 Tax=Streptomyces sp. ST2-7A TaxID=2907214 RepID=UPI001F245605|nr:hypothetical protein [Streptomyces sp. ST2-7A]MCE7082948.1 hypothetical protein [Streptomyces sp. ST2-7A]